MSSSLFLVLVFNIFVFSTAQLEECFYNVYVETGYKGTTSAVGLILSGDGQAVSVCNLKWYGSNGPDYPYFQADSRDSFTFSGSCLSDVCNATLIADGDGLSPDWFVESAGVLVYRTRGAQISPKPFVVRTFSFGTLLSLSSPPDSLIASATACSSLRSAVEIDGVLQSCSRAA